MEFRELPNNAMFIWRDGMYVKVRDVFNAYDALTNGIARPIATRSNGVWVACDGDDTWFNPYATVEDAI